MRLGIIGDTHQNTVHLSNTLIKLANEGIDTVVQLGDFGMFPAFSNNDVFLDLIDGALGGKGMALYVVRGNHDDPRIFGQQIREHIFLHPRVATGSSDEFSWVAVGGAVSIDKAYRLANEPAPGTLWFPDEQITDADVEAVPIGEVDALFTHEASDFTPWRHRVKIDDDSKRNRERIDEILRRCTPKMHFHGHYHEVYSWINSFYDDTHATRTFGLACDGMINSWGILDGENFQFGI